MLKILSAHGLFSLSRAFIGAVLVVYLMDRGIDLSVVAIAKSAQLVASVIFNYPAGLLADKYGNKLAILLACCAELIYFSLILHPSNSTVIAGEIFNGIGIALYTGAYEAWIFTQKNNKEDSFSLISRSAEMLFIATILSGLLGAIFSQYSILLSITFMGISFVAYTFTPEKKKSKTKNTEETTSSGLLKLLRTANYNVVNYVVFGGLMQLIYQFWPVFFKSFPLSYSQTKIGFVFAASMAAQWFFTYYARRKNFNKYPYAPIICYSGIILTSLITIIAPSYLFNFNTIIIALYCLFISVCAFTVNYFFSRSCNIYSDSPDESSMISLLDTSARCFGAAALAIVSLFNVQDVALIWSIFPLFTMIIAITALSKRTLYHVS
ncbi:MFS transporter [Bartonella sp. TP]|uniref:MFS transporter n=1 Tax=Bartonella sp. TP TaxID=3057550 RepID=UPI0025AFCBCE|nr:MFS transporter [Bartonella sp. TP]WJW80022.1 MFS transporter [Bartonella sp. TP]